VHSTARPKTWYIRHRDAERRASLKTKEKVGVCERERHDSRPVGDGKKEPNTKTEEYQGTDWCVRPRQEAINHCTARGLPTCVNGSRESTGELAEGWSPKRPRPGMIREREKGRKFTGRTNTHSARRSYTANDETRKYEGGRRSKMKTRERLRARSNRG